MNLSIYGEASKITFSVKARAYPNSDDYWDGNWLRCDVEINIPAFKVSFNEQFRTDEFSNFLKELKKIYQDLSGMAEFKTMEDVVYLKATMDKLGKILWKGKIIYPVGTGARLAFDFKNDQSFLPDLISQLEAIVIAFPIKGKPEPLDDSSRKI